MGGTYLLLLLSFWGVFKEGWGGVNRKMDFAGIHKHLFLHKHLNHTMKRTCEQSNAPVTHIPFSNATSWPPRLSLTPE